MVFGFKNEVGVVIPGTNANMNETLEVRDMLALVISTNWLRPS